MKRLYSVFLIICLVLYLTGCGESKPEGNIAFNNLQEMQNYLNGKWFSSQSLIGADYEYSEIVFNNEKIILCFSNVWVTEENDNISIKRNDDYDFHTRYFETPEFKCKQGQIIADDQMWNVNIKDEYLEINDRRYYKATDNVNVNYKNFAIFQDFCELSLYDKYGQTNQYNSNCRFVDMSADDMFDYGGCDENEISFELIYDGSRKARYFAQISKFNELYKEIKDPTFYWQTNVIAAIGREMTDLNKKDNYSNDTFFELEYYLYVNSNGNLVTNAHLD